MRQFITSLAPTPRSFQVIRDKPLTKDDLEALERVLPGALEKIQTISSGRVGNVDIVAHADPPKATSRELEQRILSV